MVSRLTNESFSAGVGIIDFFFAMLIIGFQMYKQSTCQYVLNIAFHFYQTNSHTKSEKIFLRKPLPAKDFILYPIIFIDFYLEN